MKKTILGLMPLLVASMLIAGCGKKAESSSAAPVSSESSEPAPVVHSYAEVRADIVAAFKEALEDEEFDLTAGEGYEYTGLRFNQTADTEAYPDKAPEATLKPAANAVKSLLPSYLVADEEHFWTGETEDDDYFGDGSTVYQAPFANEDETVGVEVISYCYNGNLLGFVYLFDLTASA